jgi:hypothetical protein
MRRAREQERVQSTLRVVRGTILRRAEEPEDVLWRWKSKKGRSRINKYPTSSYISPTDYCDSGDLYLSNFYAPYWSMHTESKSNIHFHFDGSECPVV